MTATAALRQPQAAFAFNKCSEISGEAAGTFCGQQVTPLNEWQSRILPLAPVGALCVPVKRHGIVALGVGKMTPGDSTRPIAVDPTTGG